MSRYSSLCCEPTLVDGKRRQIYYTAFVALCSLAVGMSLEWILCLDTFKTDDCDTSNKNMYGLQLLKFMLFVGVIVSAGPAAFISSNLGLKTTLVIGMMSTVLGSYGIIYSDYSETMTYLWIGRTMHGIGAGFIFVVVPNYAAEIAEPEIRDVLTSLHYISLLTGMLLSHIAREFFIYSFVNKITIPVAVLSLILLLFVQDPVYYRLKYEAPTFKQEIVLREIKDFQTHRRTTAVCHNRVYKNFKNSKNYIDLGLVFKDMVYRRPLLINVCLVFIQQFSGSVLLTNQLQCLYTMLGINEISPVAAIILLQLSVSILSSYFIGFLGNRDLLIISGVGMAVSLSLINIMYDTEINDRDIKWLLLLLSVYMIFYSIGYGPVPWILMPQICPRKSRLWTSGVTVSLWALLNQISQSIYENLSFFYRGVEICLLCNSFVCVFGAIFAYAHVPAKAKHT